MVIDVQCNRWDITTQHFIVVHSTVNLLPTHSLTHLFTFSLHHCIKLISVMVCVVVQAVVKANRKSNGNGQLLPSRWLQNPWTDFDQSWNISHRFDHTGKSMWRCDNMGGLGERVTSHMFRFLSIPLSFFLYGRPMELGRPLYFCPVVSFFLFYSLPNLGGCRLDVCRTFLHMVWP